MEKYGFKEKVKKCGFEDKVKKCVAKDRVEVKQEMRMQSQEEKCVTKDRMEVRHRAQEVRAENLVQKGEARFGDPKVRALVCNIFLNLEFELLLAWMMVMLHKIPRLRFVNVNSYNAAFRSKRDYG